MFRLGLELPDVGGKRPFILNQFNSALSIVDNSLNFSSMPHDPLVLQQASNVFLREFRDSVVIEALEGFAEILTLCKDRAPTKSRLEPFEAQLFE